MRMPSLDEIGVEARLLNCSKPEAISAGWSDCRDKLPAALGAYANGFTAVGQSSSPAAR